MTRKSRIQFSGALYHGFNWGIGDGRDRSSFLDSLALGVERFHVEIHGHGLMANPFHLLVGMPLGNISHFMQSVPIS